MHGLKYNTSLSKLAFKEYGRNVQQLVDYCVEIEDEKHRNVFAQAIIDLMGQMSPHLRNVEDFRHKLWDHLFEIANYNLDIESPYPIPLEKDTSKPPKLDYPQSRMRFRHYGKNVERLISKAIQMEDGPKKLAFTKVIANYMKMVYANWNRDGVSDELIKSDLELLSKGALTLSDEAAIKVPKQSRPKQHNKRDRGSSRGGSRGGSKGGYGKPKNNNKRRNYR
ncbi:MAG: DUF4290 domain-containing protein [Chitinophagales bacterium]